MFWQMPFHLQAVLYALQKTSYIVWRTDNLQERYTELVATKTGRDLRDRTLVKHFLR
jgi:hypothetical protein